MARDWREWGTKLATHITVPPVEVLRHEISAALEGSAFGGDERAMRTFSNKLAVLAGKTWKLSQFRDSISRAASGPRTTFSKAKVEIEPEFTERMGALAERIAVIGGADLPAQEVGEIMSTALRGGLAPEPRIH